MAARAGLIGPLHKNEREARLSLILRDRRAARQNAERAALERLEKLRRTGANGLSEIGEAGERARLERTGYAKPPTKPDKRARRLIIALGDIDAM